MLHKKNYPSHYGCAVLSQVSIVAIFVFMTKVSKLQSAFNSGYRRTSAHRYREIGLLRQIFRVPIIICNCGKVKRKTWLFTGIYGSLYLMCHTSQGSIALNSLLIGEFWLCSDWSTSLSTRPVKRRRGQ